MTDTDNPVVTAVPGGGWVAEWGTDVEHVVAQSTVLCWLVRADGAMTPMVADAASGTAHPATRPWGRYPFLGLK